MFLTLLWSQDNNNIYITIEQTNFLIEKKIIKDNYFSVKGKCNKIDYESTIYFLNNINVNNIQYKFNRHHFFTFEKLDKKKWSRLSSYKNKNSFIKCDWDKWIDSEDDSSKSEDSNDSEDTNNLENTNNLEDSDHL